MDSANAPNVFVKSYKGASSGREYEAWREETCRLLCRLDISPSEGDSIDCQLRVSLLGGLTLSVPSGSSAHFERTREILRDGYDDLVLVIATAGRVLITQEEREIELSESQMCLMDMSLLSKISQRDGVQFKTVAMPRSTLLTAYPRAENGISQVLGDRPKLRETISRYHDLSTNLAPHLDVVGQQLMAQHMVDLVGLLLGTEAERESGGHAAARFDLMRADMLASLGRHDLSLGSIARKHGLSQRHAQRFFAQAETTFTEFVLEHRLMLARKLLLDPINRSRKIIDVAYLSGFADLSYFNRAFRQRFGMTPTEMRGD
ncbi:MULTISPECIES: AraC family transcriptional regulator [unclassified Bradyrhizobium]|uniref:helix-turn-helix transcriptional regulator n=1 Tax=unclassified Bradyrhizobium TaxID=2631580 RepID=UPI0004819594|nr:MULTISPECIES: AraC family transcriptional regulator [unclassified Bradyrhizobium]MCP3464561.1 AraC family transcriptional regulator [Bradyrhizobium sp. CCGUVB23]